MRKEVQYSRALIIMDILFIIFRIPSFINTILNNNIYYICIYAFFTQFLLDPVFKVFLFFIFIAFKRI
jgi:hypothetical protein